MNYINEYIKLPNNYQIIFENQYEIISIPSYKNNIWI